MKVIVKIILLTMVALSVQAFDTTDEISVLNQEYNQYADHPIIIFDKSVIRELLTDSKEKNLQLIREHISTRFNIDVDQKEAEIILNYHTLFNDSASALPFKYRTKNSYKFCAVFPSGAQTDHQGEIERVLGINDQVNPYPSGTVKKVMSILSLEELKLISLYHELSHCLDKKYATNIYATGSHHIHMAESFAETLSIILVTKKFNFRNLALRRSILRGLYTKFMGEYIINDDTTIAMDPRAKEMGVVYYLSPVLLSINKLVSSYKFKSSNYTIDELNHLALQNTENFALSSRTFSALANFLKNGKDSTLRTYLEYSRSSPDLFYLTYLELREEILFLEDLDLLIDAF